ncbi:MAG: thioredoxin domain-containing protein [Alphaproteobacteria bacterium]
MIKYFTNFCITMFLFIVTSTAMASDSKQNIDYGTLGVGDPNAPVKFIDYSSLTCPACAKFHNGTLPAFKEKYVETGKVYFEFRDFPLDSLAAAAAMVARCAGPDKRLAIVDKLFQEQRNWRSGETGQEVIDKVMALAEPLGLPRADAENCLNDEKLFKAVLDERERGLNEDDVKATPTLIINGEKISGAMSLDDISKIVDRALVK